MSELSNIMSVGDPEDHLPVGGGGGSYNLDPTLNVDRHRLVLVTVI